MNYNELGFAILKCRRERDLSQEELAGLSGVSRNYLSLIERGKADNVSVEILVKLAKAMQIDPVYWFGILVGDE